MQQPAQQPASTDSELYERARKRVEDLRGFYVHALVYLVVNLGLWTMDLVTGGGLQWAYWPTLGWGIGLAIHAVVTFAEFGPFNEAWGERKTEEYVARMRERGTGSGRKAS